MARTSHRRSRAPHDGKTPKRSGVVVRAPLGVNEWSISCPDEWPDRRVQDQLIVAMGYDTAGAAKPRNVSLRIGNAVVVLDAPAITALRQLLWKAQPSHV